MRRVQIEKPGALSMKAHLPDISRNCRNPVRNWLEILRGVGRARVCNREHSQWLFTVIELEPAANQGAGERPRPSRPGDATERGSGSEQRHNVGTRNSTLGSVA